MNPSTLPRRLLPAALLAALAAALTGCVERKITIASDPPGALVYVNDVEVGRTPVAFPFLWYGDYDVRLRLDRNEGTPDNPKPVQYYLHTHRRASAPPFQWLGVDLFAELLPVDLKDDKLWAFALAPVPQPTDEQLVQSAKNVQSRINTPTALQRFPTQPTPPAK